MTMRDQEKHAVRGLLYRVTVMRYTSMHLSMLTGSV